MVPSISMPAADASPDAADELDDDVADALM
jgi:hypothetical protein